MQIKYDFISDTITKPTVEMKKQMMKAALGDDVFSEDATVNKLEARMAEMYGMEDGIFCPSGTMTNQIALKMHTQPLDELICEQSSHIYQYESAGYAFHSSVAINPLVGEDGKLSPQQIINAIKPKADWLPRTSVVFIENTCNRAGGTVYELSRLKSISTACKEHGLSLHIDGARIFNAIATGAYRVEDLHGLFDSISICLSKGLGCPVGSVLLGSWEDIALARRIRKVMGGGMRQAGILAAAGLYALDHHIDDLKEDHEKAHLLAHTLAEQPYTQNIIPVETNIIILELYDSMTANTFCQQLLTKNIRASEFGKHKVRFVTHRDISFEMTKEACTLINNE